MRIYRLASFVFACLAAATFANAQVNRATISGTVTDPSGAPIPGVVVTITGESGLAQTAHTNEAGQYTVPSLPVGTYSAKFEIQGFKTSVRDKLTLQVAQTLRLDAALEVGQLAETVTVSGAFEIIQRDTPDVGTTVSREYLTSLPLSMGGGRYPETFAYKTVAGRRRGHLDVAHQRQSGLLKGSPSRGRVGDDLSRRSFRRVERLDGGAAGIQDPDERPLGRIRPNSRRRVQLRHALGTEPVAWDRFRHAPERGAEREHVSQQRRRPSQVARSTK